MKFNQKSHSMNSQPTCVSTFAITHKLIIHFGVRELCFTQANTQTQNCIRATSYQFETL